MANDPTQTIQGMLNDYVNGKGHVGVMAGIISPDVPNGQELLAGGAGTFWNTQYNPMTLDGNTLFEIGSITKVFTSLLQYSRRGGYVGALGDFVTPLQSASVASIPILDLANYSPGFPTDNRGGFCPPGTLQSLTTLINYLTSQSKLPQNPPGTCYSYSNFGWSLLALAALGVSSDSDPVQQAWSQAIQALTTDFNMSSNTAPYDSSMDVNLPVGYDAKGEIFSKTHSYAPSAPMTFGAGDLVSTGNDMLLWLAVQMGRINPSLPFLKVQQGQTWNLPQCNKGQKTLVVTLGWFQHTLSSGGQQATYLAKDGGVGGFTSWMGFQSWVGTGQPSEIGFFCLTNSCGALALGQAIMSILLGFPPGDEPVEEVKYVTPA